MQYLEIRNWRRFQHYKNRTPPWIKLHYEIITSPDWVMMDDASKLLAVVCMLIASRNEGRVPLNPAYLKKVAHLSKTPDLKPLIECGFFGDASVLQANASTNEDKETETYRKEAEERARCAAIWKKVWEAFPRQRRGAEAKGLIAWENAIKRATPEEILEGCLRYAKSDDVARGFAKGCQAWLNDDGWTYGDAPKGSAKSDDHIYAGLKI